MEPFLLNATDDDLAELDFWQLRGLYVGMVLDSALSAEAPDRLAEVGRKLDELYGTEWRSGSEPVFH